MMLDHKNADAIADGILRVADFDPFLHALCHRAGEAQRPSGPVAMALVKLGTAKDAKRSLGKLDTAITECVEILDRKARAANG